VHQKHPPANVAYYSLFSHVCALSLISFAFFGHQFLAREFSDQCFGEAFANFNRHDLLMLAQLRVEPCFQRRAAIRGALLQRDERLGLSPR
jgi:hypothetical protein